MTKICKECKQEKDESKFSKDRTTKDGLRYRCKACDSLFRNYVRNNPYIRGKQYNEDILKEEKDQ